MCPCDRLFLTARVSQPTIRGLSNWLATNSVQEPVFFLISKIPVQTTATEKYVHRAVVENGLTGHELYVQWPHNGAAAGAEARDSLANGTGRIPFSLTCKQRLPAVV